ncbi:MHC class II transactivator [Tachyglossus aculeatus]|uniref:MHC class II transactivator n=1 Tax=Tachyglossus aculeatus TaxID=9261 RepID=UPI0018F73CA6|nr:MHC class II transactivator [Tachyglossus aculeatus]
MEPGTLAEGSFLRLLQSDTDPLQLIHLYDQMPLGGEEEIEFSPDPDTDTAESINCDQVTKLWNEIEGDESTREAYDSIAALAEYVLRDQQLERLPEDIFENLGADEMAIESPELLPDLMQKCPKRPSSDIAETHEDPTEPKHRKTELKSQSTTRRPNRAHRWCDPYRAGPPDVPVATSSLLTMPVGGSSAAARLLSLLPGQDPYPIHPSFEEALLAPSPSSSFLSCVNVTAGEIRMVPTLPTGPQPFLHFSLGNGISNLIICPGDSTIHSLPVSPDRNSSPSPFAPSAGDVPNMPEPAAMTSNCRMEDITIGLSQEATVHPDQPPKRPKLVERFCSALREEYGRSPQQDGPRGGLPTLDGFYIDGGLVRAQLETKPGKNAGKCLEKELAIYDLAERQKAHVSRRDVFISRSGRPRETQVIALLGKAGMGKSAFVRAVCQDWGADRLPQFEFVFHFEGRRLNLPGAQFSLRGLLFELCLQPPERSEEVFKYILRHPERVLILLDAFEGLLDGPEGFLHCQGCSSPRESHTIKGLLAGLFQKKLLSGCTLLIAVRPKDKFSHFLAKVDSIVEVVGFSPEQAEAYVVHYFNGSPHGAEALTLLRARPYLLSHCHNPGLCRLLCQLCETLLAPGGLADLPTTLTGLCVALLRPELAPGGEGVAGDQYRQQLRGLAELAWALGQNHQDALRDGHFPSRELKEFAEASGFMQPFPGAGEPGSVFSSFFLQNFLGALKLALTDEAKDKELPKYLALTPRKKKPHDNWLEGVPRLLAGLLFQPQDSCLGLLRGEGWDGAVAKKQKTLLRYLKRLQYGSLDPGRLLELLHCIHEACDGYLWRHVASSLPAELSFQGTRLTPPDVHVLGEVLQAAGKEFSLDLRNSSVDLLGLRRLVGLSSVSQFRASLSDTARLWESLQLQGEDEQLRSATDKFTIDPFKVKSLKDVDELCSLVQIQDSMVQGRSIASDDAPAGISAVRNLRKLEFALGPVWGPQGFPKLVEILAALPSLQHLDLDALSENKIGDDGAAKLSAVFPELKYLETLNLSQNSITDLGAQELARALPCLSSLITLSLYNNCICDAGAEELAQVLPEMSSLKVLNVQYNKITAAGAQKLTASLRKCPQMETLAMWNPTIPYGFQEHLQQLDSRISLR